MGRGSCGKFERTYWCCFRFCLKTR